MYYCSLCRYKKFFKRVQYGHLIRDCTIYLRSNILKNRIVNKNIPDTLNSKKGLRKVEVLTGINGLRCKLLTFIVPSIEGFKMLLSSDCKSKRKQGPHGSSFEYYIIFCTCFCGYFSSFKISHICNRVHETIQSSA